MKKYSDKFKYNNSFSDSLPIYGSTYIKKSNSSNPFSIAKPFGLVEYPKIRDRFKDQRMAFEVAQVSETSFQGPI